MVITEFKRVGKSNKIKIYVDGEYYATLLDETVVSNNLKLNVEYSEKFLNDVVDSGQNLLALDTGLKILSLFLKTELELRNYLKGKGFNNNAIEFAVSKLKGYNYLNDEHYVQNYIETRRHKKGKKAIKYELKLKGVSEELIEKYLENLIENQINEIEVIANKFVKNKDKNAKLKEKLFRHLTAKGFDYEEINMVIKEIFKN